MRRLAVLFALLAAAAADARPPAAWVTVSGQVVLPAGVPLPPPKVVPGFPGVPDESALVNPNSRGVRNAVVWLRPNIMDPKAKLTAAEIHPDDRLRPKHTHVVAVTPQLLFAPRVLAARPGDAIVVQNTAAAPVNLLWTSGNNGDINANVAAKAVFPFPAPLAAETTPIPYKAAATPAFGIVRVFEHPYHAVTDADGRFELRNAPVGKYRLVYWHENKGFKNGKNGRFGAAVELAAGADGTQALPAVPFDVR